MAQHTSLWMGVLTLLSLCASYAAAFGPHGARERCFAWAAYELETGARATRPITPTVAPDCASSFGHPDQRCTIEEFLQYIWAPDPHTTGPHTSPVLPEGSVQPRDGFSSYTNCWNQVFRAYDMQGRGGVKYVDFERLFPGATGYGDALARIGQSVSTALTAYHINNDMLERSAQRFANMATGSIKEVQAIRYMQYEEYRLPALRVLRSLGGMRIGTRHVDLSWMEGRRSFPALDIQATADLNPLLSEENVRSILVAGVQEINDAVTIDNHGNEGRHAGEHWDMVQYTRMAMSNAKCRFTHFPPF